MDATNDQYSKRNYIKSYIIFEVTLFLNLVLGLCIANHIFLLWVYSWEISLAIGVCVFFIFNVGFLVFKYLGFIRKIFNQKTIYYIIVEILCLIIIIGLCIGLSFLFIQSPFATTINDHILLIYAKDDSEIRIGEISINGEKTPLRKLKNDDTWILEKKWLVSKSVPAQLEYIYYSDKKEEEILILFSESPQAGNVIIKLDGKIIGTMSLNKKQDGEAYFSEIVFTQSVGQSLLINIYTGFNVLSIVWICLIFYLALRPSVSLKSLKQIRIDSSIILIIFIISHVIAVTYVSFVNRTNQIYYWPTDGYDFPDAITDIIYPYGIFFSLVICFAYIIFRFGMNRSIASLCTMIFMTSSNHLNFLPGSPYYDYIKVPFVFFALILSILTIKLNSYSKHLWLLSAIFGLVIGWAQRYRGGVQIYILYYIIIIIFFLNCPFNRFVKNKLFSIMLVIISYYFVTSPMFGPMPAFTYSQYNIVTPIMGGFMEPINNELHVSTTSYDLGYLFIDRYIAFQTCIKDYLTKDFSSSCYVFSPNMEVLSIPNRLFEILTIFPADVLTRIYASILRIIELPFTYLEPPFGVTDQTIRYVYTIRSIILNPFSGSGLILVIICLLLLSYLNIRYALFVLFSLLFLGGYPSIQFLGKHYFHLEIIPIYMIGLLLDNTVKLIRFVIVNPIVKNGKLYWKNFVEVPQDKLKGPILRVVFFSLASAGLVILPLVGLRIYQSYRVTELNSQLLNSITTNITINHSVIDEYTTLLFDPQQRIPSNDEQFVADYYVMGFGGTQCNFSTIWPVFRYHYYTNPREDYSRTLRVDLSENSAELTYVYFSQVSMDKINQFKGIELPSNQSNCLKVWGKVMNTDELPIIANIILPINRQGFSPFYQQIVNVETNQSLTIPASLPMNLTQDIIRKKYYEIDPSQIRIKDDIVNIQNNRWNIRGYADIPGANPYDHFNLNDIDYSRSLLYKNSIAEISVGQIRTDLVITKPFTVKKRSYFVAEGNIYSGGITFGLVKDGHTAGFVHVFTPGEFNVVISIPEDGDYWIGLANNLNNYTTREQHLTISKIGWVMAEDIIPK